MTVDPIPSGPRRRRSRTIAIAIAMAMVPAFLAALLSPSAAQAASNPSLVYVNQGSGKCLDLPRASQRPRTRLQLYRCHGGAPQTFTESPVYPRRWEIANQCLDVAGAGTSPGASVIVFPCHTRDNQRWSIDYTTGLIRGVGSQLCLRAQGTADGAAIVLAECDPTDPEQLWRSNLARLADTVAPTLPGVPRIVELRCDRALFTWAPSRDENTRTPFYHLLRDGQSVVARYAPNGRDMWIALTPQTEHRLSLTATDDAGNTSAPGPSLTLTAPACPDDSGLPTAPTGLKATPLSQTSVALTWTASTDDRGVVGYDILRDGKVIGQIAETLLEPETAYNDYTLGAGETHTYSVVARDSAGHTSPPSAVVSATTEATAR